ncbi:phosphotransferase family protein [Myceligenerans pegani]|uniref:Aminoglycoside phosphotransferase family protein n=1 Tax=Myceligenerans pegani TaxID=2776917 RepID=A0ABR9N428_9MICO|nr:phosphotransferase [Myceligenerans sp. TRM 65318]MBE1878419.1 aminoglycoside phosphotransferase family protein [Myceligenerans sp. TRM 65318]MBE3020690.1 aminoglycoside phosphotransferase family protein [Myceligenerans sp. TRM 65318]
MSATAELPAAVVTAVARHAGGVEGIERLGGLSGRTVVAVHGRWRTVVVKGPVTRVEVAAATELVDPLARHGVRVPRTLAVVDATGDSAGDDWVVMEHLPRALPRERWGADGRVVDMLRGLHAMPRELVEHLSDRYRPRWDPSLTAAACVALDADQATAGRLADLAERAQDLFFPDRVVSGDPNPLNWRLDDHDSPVLVDWERITVASPAIDLAIVLPGLPDREAAASMVAAYGNDALGVDDILLAKAWTVVELAATAAAGSAAREVIEQIRASFLDWLDVGPP